VTRSRRVGDSLAELDSLTPNRGGPRIVAEMQDREP